MVRFICLIALISFFLALQTNETNSQIDSPLSNLIENFQNLYLKNFCVWKKFFFFLVTNIKKKLRNFFSSKYSISKEDENAILLIYT